MSDKKILIADGHHRYETAINSRNEARRARRGGAGSICAGRVRDDDVCEHDGKGMTILPTHRLITQPCEFRFREVPQGCGAHLGLVFLSLHQRRRARVGLRGISQGPRERQAQAARHRRLCGQATRFICSRCGRMPTSSLLLPDVCEAQRGLDIVLLHRLLIDKGLGITEEKVTADENVTIFASWTAPSRPSMKASAARVSADPVDVKQVAEIALGGDVMPQKSTDFYPKLLSGIAIYTSTANASKARKRRRVNARATVRPSRRFSVQSRASAILAELQLRRHPARRLSNAAAAAAKPETRSFRSARTGAASGYLRGRNACAQRSGAMHVVRIACGLRMGVRRECCADWDGGSY